MKKKRNLIGWAFLFSILILGMLILDFLALHDVKQDYVSPNVLRDFNVNLSDLLPEWTATKGEWWTVQISFIVKLILTILIILGLGKALISKSTKS